MKLAIILPGIAVVVSGLAFEYMCKNSSGSLHRMLSLDVAQTSLIQNIGLIEHTKAASDSAGLVNPTIWRHIEASCSEYRTMKSKGEEVSDYRSRFNPPAPDKCSEIERDYNAGQLNYGKLKFYRESMHPMYVTRKIFHDTKSLTVQ